MEQMEEVQKKVIDIYPTKNSRRILVFFSDLLILFISCVFLFEIVVNPLVKLAANYTNTVSQADTYSRSRNEILYDNKLLFYEKETKYEFQNNLDYTATQFLKFYVFDDKTLQNEVIFHYFVDLRGEDVTYINDLYKNFGGKYFDLSSYTSIGTYAFKNEYIDLLSPYFVEGDELSSDGLTELELYKENCFLRTKSC